MKNLKRWLNYVLILGGITALMIYMFFVFYPFKTFTIKSALVNNPIPAGQDLPTVKAGGTLSYSVDYCKFTTKGSSVQRQIVSDTNAIPYPPVTSVAKEGCHVVRIPLPISPVTPPGVYKLRVVATYKVNALREIPTSFETDNFRVE